MRRALFLSFPVLALLALAGCGGGDVSTTTSHVATTGATASTTADIPTSAALDGPPLVEIGAVAPTIIDTPYLGALLTATPQAGGTATFEGATVSVHRER